jgi:hypothetical protein
MYNTYRLIPGRMTMRLIRALLALGAKLPRYFVLCLAREREAQVATNVQMKNHLAYRQNLHDQLEQRTVALEKQRLDAIKMQQDAISEAERAKEDREKKRQARVEAGESAEDEYDQPIPPVPSLDEFMSLLPLPTLPELKVVPPPDPLPVTATSYLPPGSQELLVSLGTELYGNVFPPRQSPPQEELFEALPEQLQFFVRLSHNSSNPGMQWPPDDAFTFAYLIRMAGSPVTSGKPQESWAKVCMALRALIDLYSFVPNLSVGPANKSIRHWRLAASDLLAGQANMGSESANANMPLARWLPGEMFLYDSGLAQFLAKYGGIPDEDINSEVAYWVRIE